MIDLSSVIDTNNEEWKLYDSFAGRQVARIEHTDHENALFYDKQGDLIAFIPKAQIVVGIVRKGGEK